MSDAPVRVLILPGIGNSGPLHWQSEWERHDPSMHRLLQDEWDAPRCADWVARLDENIGAHDAPVVLATHSSSCALVAHWVTQTSAQNIARVKGALLVAPSDPTGPNYPIGPTGFAPVPLIRLPFRSTVVASDDDIYVTEATARSFAAAWGSQFVLMPGGGHINADTGLGLWTDGLRMLQILRA